MKHSETNGNTHPQQPTPKMDLCEISRVYGHAAILAMRDNERPFNPDDFKPAPIVIPAGSSGMAALDGSIAVPRQKYITFFIPSELRDYTPAHGIVLVGDCHIMRGEVFIIGGEPGVGKSLCATWLAMAGAMGTEWFGLKIHRPFKTMIVQTENGRYRLQKEFSALPCEQLDAWIRVSEPPPFGLTLTNAEFQHDIRAALEEFKPDCVILDSWNSAARDDKQRDYSETFDALRALLPKGPDKPALGIVAHTRKPQPAEKRTGGTGLMHILAGSHVLSSVPRSVFVMTRASEDESDDRVVWFNPKNNNGELIQRTAWRRGNGGFEAVGDFDWEAFDKTAEGGAPQKVTIDHLREVFESCDTMELSDAVERLMIVAGVSQSTVYRVLGEGGQFAAHLTRNGKMLAFKE
ncbi:MAG TPA: AAA family ATPase [Chthoniobacteraceae bacterium]|nr:AAA family ATPase [Chthoniobacteraceae bacterium]